MSEINSGINHGDFDAVSATDLLSFRQVQISQRSLSVKIDRSLAVNERLTALVNKRLTALANFGGLEM